MNVCVYVRMYVCMYASMFVYMYVYACMRFVQKVSGLTTVHEVAKAYRVLTLIAFFFLPQPHTSPTVSATVGNILQTPLSGCLIVSSSNFVLCLPLSQIGVLSEPS